jgi:hypothetical protein
MSVSPGRKVNPSSNSMRLWSGCLLQSEIWTSVLGHSTKKKLLERRALFPHAHVISGWLSADDNALRKTLPMGTPSFWKTRKVLEEEVVTSSNVADTCTHLPWSVWAAVTEHRRLGGLSKSILITIPEAENPRSRYPHSQVLEKAFFLTCRWCLLTAGSFIFLWGHYSCRVGSILMTTYNFNYLPKVPIPNAIMLRVRTVTYEFGDRGQIQIFRPE